MKLVKKIIEFTKKSCKVSKSKGVSKEATSPEDAKGVSKEADCIEWVSKNNKDIKDYYFDSDNSSLFTIESNFYID
jgi:hypothetical protein